MYSRGKILLTVISVFLTAVVSQAYTTNKEDLAVLDKAWPARYFGSYKEERVDYALKKYGKSWDFEDGTTGRVSHLSPGIENARVEGGKFKFTMAQTNVFIAWGAYSRIGKVAFEEDFKVPQESGWASAEVAVKQTKDLSKWFIATRIGGDHQIPSYWLNKGQRELKGTESQKLKADIKVPADGLVLQIEGPAGNEIEIDSVSVFGVRNFGYYRKTFELPSDKIWSAILNISRPGMTGHISINGQKVYEVDEIRNGAWNPWRRTAYNPVPVEVASYLKPGRNVICAYGERIGYPPQFLIQGYVNCVDGKRVLIKTDETWLWSDREETGWEKTDFDDSKWKKTGRVGTPGFGYFSADEFPYYSGFLRVINPYQRKLYYRERDDVKFRIELPIAFAGRVLPLNYEIECLTGTRAPLKGTVEKGAGEGDNLMYECNAGKLLPGVYRARFTIGGQEEEGLQPRVEDFAVVGPIPQKTVAGNSYEEGMELELEDTIDCANPQDQHRFYDSDGKIGSKIVEKDGLKYRETEPYGCYFSYAIKFKETGYPYLIAVDYPDNRERLIEFSVQVITTAKDGKKDLGWDVTTPGVICGGGGKFPLTGKMQTLQFFHWARTPEVAINIENNPFAFESRAAVSKIRIYRVKEMPAVMTKKGERFFGVGTEWGDIVANTFRPGKEQFPAGFTGFSASWRDINENAEWYKVFEAFIKYLRFSGQNLVNMGSWMYTGPRYYEDRLVNDSSLEQDFRHLLLAMFEENDLYMSAGIEYCYSLGFGSVYRVTDKEVAEEGKDTVWSVSKSGKQFRKDLGGGPDVCANSLHPVVQKEILRIVDELLNKFKDYKSFKGLTFHVFPGIYSPTIGMDSWSGGSSALEWGYDDISIQRFQNDTGKKIPVDIKDPKRFEKRYNWLMANARDKWISWRCEKIFELEKEIFRHVKDARKDLVLVNNLAMYPCYVKQWVKSGLPVKEYLRQMGYDPALYRKIKDLYFSRYQFQLICHWVQVRGTDQYYNWAWANSPEVVELFDREESRGYCMQWPFDEHGYGQDGENNEQEWPWKLKNFGSHIIAWPVPGHKYFKEAWNRSFIDSDPDLMTFCMFDSNIPVGHEQEMREFARVFTALPVEKFARLAGAAFNPNVVVKELYKGGNYYFTVINPGWWEAEAELELQGLKDGQEIASLTDESKLTVRDGKVKVPLAPYEIKAFSVPSKKAKVLKAEVSIKDRSGVEKYFTQRIDVSRNLLANPEAADLLAEDELAHCKKCLTEVEEFIRKGNYFQANDRIADWKFNQLMATRVARLSSTVSWQVIGPFPNDTEGKGFFTSYEVEKDVLAAGDIDKAKSYDGVEGKVKWRKALSILRGTDAFVDFNEIFNPNDWVCAYAFRKISSPQEQEATLSLGSDDGAKVWFNGKEVIAKYMARGASPGQDKVKVRLNKGENTILIKVEEQIGGWGFYFDVLGADGKPLTLGK